MAAAAAPYGALPIDLRLWYYTQREEITSTSQRYHWCNFPTDGSPPAGHLRKYTKTNEIETMAAVDAPYERLPMELRLWYCAQRKGIAHNSQWYHWIIFHMTGSHSMTLFRCYTNTNDIRYCPNHDRRGRPYGALSMELLPWYCTHISFSSSIFTILCWIFQIWIISWMEDLYRSLLFWCGRPTDIDAIINLSEASRG